MEEKMICSISDTGEFMKVEIHANTVNQVLELIPSLTSSILRIAVKDWELDTQGIIDLMISSVGNALTSALDKTKDPRLFAPLLVWKKISNEYFIGDEYDEEEPDNSID